MTHCVKSLRQSASFGMYGKEDAEMLGTNAKMTSFMRQGTV